MPDDKVNRVAVGMRFVNHMFAVVDPRLTHGAGVNLAGKLTPGRITRHQSFNEAVSRAFAFTGILVTKEPTDMARGDGKCPGDMKLVP